MPDETIEIGDNVVFLGTSRCDYSKYAGAVFKVTSRSERYDRYGDMFTMTMLDSFVRSRNLVINYRTGELSFHMYGKHLKKVDNV